MYISECVERMNEVREQVATQKLEQTVRTFRKALKEAYYLSEMNKEDFLEEVYKELNHLEGF